MPISRVFYGWWVTLALLIHQTGAALGSWLGGMLFERTGGYGPAFALGCAVLVAASVVSLLIDERPRALSETAPVTGAR